jgi:hypothetical protein
MWRLLPRATGDDPQKVVVFMLETPRTCAAVGDSPSQLSFDAVDYRFPEFHFPSVPSEGLDSSDAAAANPSHYSASNTGSVTW